MQHSKLQEPAGRHFTENYDNCSKESESNIFGVELTEINIKVSSPREISNGHAQKMLLTNLRSNKRVPQHNLPLPTKPFTGVRGIPPK